MSDVKQASRQEQSRMQEAKVLSVLRGRIGSRTERVAEGAEEEDVAILAGSNSVIQGPAAKGCVSFQYVTSCPCLFPGA